MKPSTNTAINNGNKKSYTKPELQVYGTLIDVTNASTNRTGKKTDAGIHTNRTH